MKTIPEKGDIVKCNYNFDEERAQYKLPYPIKGQYLTVREALRRDLGTEWVWMLFFEELRLSIPLYADRFDVMQREAEGDGLLNDAYKIANNL